MDIFSDVAIYLRFIYNKNLFGTQSRLEIKVMSYGNIIASKQQMVSLKKNRFLKFSESKANNTDFLFYIRYEYSPDIFIVEPNEPKKCLLTPKGAECLREVVDKYHKDIFYMPFYVSNGKGDDDTIHQILSKIMRNKFHPYHLEKPKPLDINTVHLLQK